MAYQIQRYNYIQFVALEVYTETNVLRMRAQDHQRIQGLAAGTKGKLTQDMLNQLNIICEAIDQALAICDNGGTLKVFVAPEGLLRPAQAVRNSGRAYSLGEAEALLEALKEIFEHSDFLHWLFIPGTMLWEVEIEESKTQAAENQRRKEAEAKQKIQKSNSLSLAVFKHSLRKLISAPDTTEAEIVEIKDTSVVMNTAIVIKGGSSEAPACMVHKAYYADIDDVAEAYRPGLNFLKDEFRKDNAKLANLTFDNVRFGVETCLDHGSKLLRDTLRDYYGLNANNTDKYRLDFHVMMGCGSRITSKGIAAWEGCYFFRVDGSQQEQYSRSFSSIYPTDYELITSNGPIQGLCFTRNRGQFSCDANIPARALLTDDLPANLPKYKQLHTRVVIFNHERIITNKVARSVFNNNVNNADVS